MNHNFFINFEDMNLSNFHLMDNSEQFNEAISKNKLNSLGLK